MYLRSSRNQLSIQFWRRRFLRISILFTKLSVCVSLNTNVLQSVSLWCNDHQGGHHSLLTKNVTSWFDFLMLFRRSNCWLVALQAKNVVVCTNMWDLHVNMWDSPSFGNVDKWWNRKWSSTGLRIQTDYFAWKPF